MGQGRGGWGGVVGEGVGKMNQEHKRGQKTGMLTFLHNKNPG